MLFVLAGRVAGALFKQGGKIRKIIKPGSHGHFADIHAALAKQQGIAVQIVLDIPSELTVDALELSMAVSNLMENAINACGRLPQERNAYLRFTAHHAGRLLLEMENPCAEDTVLGADGFPFTRQVSHGVGSKSVQAFANKYNGELLYQVKEGVFRVRLLV